MHIAVAQQLATERLGYVFAAESFSDCLNQPVVVGSIVGDIDRCRLDLGSGLVLGIFEPIDPADLMVLAVEHFHADLNLIRKPFHGESLLRMSTEGETVWARTCSVTATALAPGSSRRRLRKSCEEAAKRRTAALRPSIPIGQNCQA